MHGDISKIARVAKLCTSTAKSRAAKLGLNLQGFVKTDDVYTLDIFENKNSDEMHLEFVQDMALKIHGYSKRDLNGN